MFADEVKQHHVTNPSRRIILSVEGEVRGRWDGPRLQQVLRNLVSNACKYGAKDEPVRVALHGDSSSVRFEVRNLGPTIAPEVAESIFDPLQRGDLDGDSSHKQGLGLGLFIVREIARAHGGSAKVQSDAVETVFSVQLPRLTVTS